MLSRQTTQFRGGCTSSRVTSWRTGRQIAVRAAEHLSVVAVHKPTLGNVEFALNERSGKRRRRKPVAAASRVGDAPTGRALKRVRFAESRVDDNAEIPEPTPDAEAASSSSAPAPSTEPSAIGVPDQVMSEGATGSSNAAVRLSMKRSSDSSNSESETKKLHTDHSTRDVVMLLDDSDVSHAAERCREVCRRKGTFFVDVNDWDCESRDNLRTFGSDGTTVACSSGGESPGNSCRMSRDSSIFLQ